MTNVLKNAIVPRRIKNPATGRIEDACDMHFHSDFKDFCECLLDPETQKKAKSQPQNSNRHRSVKMNEPAPTRKSKLIQNLEKRITNDMERKKRGNEKKNGKKNGK